MRKAAAALGIAAALTSTVALADTLSVTEVGSFHVGGRSVSLSGLPTRDVVFTSDRIAQMLQQWMTARGLMK